MKKIKKAIIPAAGFGTRFLPATKALPKEMFPIVDKPVMQYLVEEAVGIGVEDIVIVTWRNKRAIEDHFDANPELEILLEQRGKTEALKKIKRLNSLANIVYIRQPYPRWDGDAILRAKDFLGNEPFLILFWDDIIDNTPSAAQQLADKFFETGAPVIATIPVKDEEVSSYWIIEGQKDGKLIKASKILEKPQPSQTISRNWIVGKYVVTPEIFDYLQIAQNNSQSDEFRLADAFELMLQGGKNVYGVEIEGNRFDTGSKLWYIKATIHFGLKEWNGLAQELKEFLRDLGF